MRQPLLPLALLSLTLAACTGPSSGQSEAPPYCGPPPESISAENRMALTEGNTEFATQLYHELARSADGNLFFSPWSVSAALAMTHAGARGRTATEIAEALRFTLPPEVLHPAFQAQTSELLGNRGPNELRIANALWAESRYPFLPEYLSLVEGRYGAAAENAEFADDPEAARERINDWVADQTNDRITDLFPRGSIDPLTRLVLTNAVYFRGSWAHEFPKDHTQDEPFLCADGTEQSVPLMRQTETFGYHRGDGFQVLDLGYRETSLSMIVVLPDERDGLAALEEQLTGETLRTWIDAIRYREVVVYLPKFELTGEFALTDTLRALGVDAAFGAEADFSGMDGTTDLFVQAIVHKAWVAVDEKGTEAAAATGVAVGWLSAPAAPPTVFRADHPFLFLIYDHLAETVLFLGRYTSP